MPHIYLESFEKWSANDLIDAHIDHESTRAIERLMKAKMAKTIDPLLMSPGMKVYVYYKSSKQNEANEWIDATIVNVDSQIITCEKRAKGPPMNVNYDDLRLIPPGELARELMRNELYDDSHDEAARKLRTDVENNAKEEENRERRPWNESTNQKLNIYEPDFLTQTNLFPEHDSYAQRNNESAINQTLHESATGNTGKDIGQTEIGSGEIIGDITSVIQKILENFHK